MWLCVRHRPRFKPTIKDLLIKKLHITSSKYHITLFKVPHHPLQSTTSPSSKYHNHHLQITWFIFIKYTWALKSDILSDRFRVPVLSGFTPGRNSNSVIPVQSTTPPSLKYHTTLFKVPQYPLQITTIPSSNYHNTLFKLQQYPLQITTIPSSKYHTTLFKLPQYPLQSTTPPSSKYHTNIFKLHKSILCWLIQKILCLFEDVNLSELTSVIVWKSYQAWYKQ